MLKELATQNAIPSERKSFRNKGETKAVSGKNKTKLGGFIASKPTLKEQLGKSTSCSLWHSPAALLFGRTSRGSCPALRENLAGAATHRCARTASEHRKGKDNGKTRAFGTSGRKSTKRINTWVKYNRRVYCKCAFKRKGSFFQMAP